MEEILEIGVVAKPQGIKGEIKVQIFSQEEAKLKTLKSVFIDGTEYKITSLKVAPNALLIGLFGVADRNLAESFRGKIVACRRQDLKELQKGRYYVVDLIGLTLKVGENAVGEITEILSLKTDVVTVKDYNGKILRFPFLKDLNTKIDFEEKTFTVEEKRFNEVVCYEN